MKYYIHDATSFEDEKIAELYQGFGYEGLGLYYTVLEKLTLQEKPIKTSVLKRQLEVGKKLEKCWSFMESSGILSSNNGDTSSIRLTNFIESYQKNKNKNKNKVAEWRENQSVEKNVTGYVPITVKNVTDLKEKKRKENNKEVKEKVPDSILAWDNSGVYFSPDAKKIWINLCNLSSWKKKALTSLELALKKLSEFQEPFAIQLMEKSIMGNYQGIVFPNTKDEYQKWLNGNNLNNGNNGQIRYSDSDHDNPSIN